VSVQKKLRSREQKRAFRVRKKQISRKEKLRISVFRSINHIYAQIVDDKEGKTLASFSSLKLSDNSQDKKSTAHKVGVELGKRALEANLGSFFFDRGRYLYHGRVAALAEGLRESGLKF
jgi:large subunit ribosomal protein L18